MRTRMIARTKRRSITAVVAGSMLLLMLVSTLCAGLITNKDPLTQDVNNRLEAPGTGVPLGTDGFGRDVLSRVLHGGRVTLLVALSSVTAAGVCGIVLGALSGYVGGRLDLILQRGVELMLGFPFLVLAIVLIVALTPSPFSVVVAVALGLLPRVVRLARAATISIRGESYIEAAVVGGAGSMEIVLKHIIPNVLSPLLAQITGYFGTAVAAETTLSFLGLGVPPPYPSWGRMLQEGAGLYFEAAPWVALSPGVALTITVLSVALIGDVLSDRYST